jgi:hypothetical protein
MGVNSQIVGAFVKMSELKFVLGGASFPVERLVTCQVCDALAGNHQIEEFPVQSQVTTDILQLFVSAVQGEVIELTNENIEGLSSLCDEFQFKSLSQRVAAFKNTPAYRVAQLEERFAQLEVEVSALRLAAETNLKNLKDCTDPLQSDVALLQGSTDSLQSSQQSAAMAQNGVIETLERLRLTVGILKDWVGPWDSVIISDFPAIFADFREKRFSLLWRGSRDGFGVGDFHSRCDGHANTLTVILDTNGNIFGGFTPVEWASCGGYRDDPSLKSFVFTLKNPHNVPARRFGLKTEFRHRAILCGVNWGPRFGCDIYVSNNCNACNSSNSAYFGYNWVVTTLLEYGGSYINDTGLDGKTVFTGSPDFQVKEIEMFEVTA